MDWRSFSFVLKVGNSVPMPVARFRVHDSPKEPEAQIQPTGLRTIVSVTGEHRCSEEGTAQVRHGDATRPRHRVCSAESHVYVEPLSTNVSL